MEQQDAVTLTADDARQISQMLDAVVALDATNLSFRAVSLMIVPVVRDGKVVGFLDGLQDSEDETGWVWRPASEEEADAWGRLMEKAGWARIRA